MGPRSEITGRELLWVAMTHIDPERDEMSKEQKSNREKKKPKQDKSAKPSNGGTAYAQAKAGSKR
jgi:hypothetical protein